MTELLEEHPMPVRIEAGAYDFIDFGSSMGGSIDYCMRRFGVRRGFGIDLLLEEVEQIRSRGMEAIQADILNFECPPGAVSFISMMDFLEHLPGADCVEAVLERAKGIARNFLFIRHPSFDDEHYLNAVGLKQYWTDWPEGHTAKVTSEQFTQMFRRLGLNQYSMTYRRPVVDSDDPAILPLAAQPEQHEYDLAKHGPKPQVTFPRPVYSQIDFFIALRPFEADEWNRITTPWDV